MPCIHVTAPSGWSGVSSLYPLVYHEKLRKNFFNTTSHASYPDTAIIIYNKIMNEYISDDKASLSGRNFFAVL